jgi:hypothetical protein
MNKSNASPNKYVVCSFSQHERLVVKRIKSGREFHAFHPKLVRSRSTAYFVLSRRVHTESRRVLDAESA